MAKRSRDSIDLAFSRALLREAMADLKEQFPDIRVMKDGWVYEYGYGRGSWEFHGPQDFYWHGSAGNAYEARYKGWMAWCEAMKRRAEKARAGMSAVAQ